MTTLYTYLHSLVDPHIPGGIHLGLPESTPNSIYAIVEEGFDSTEKEFFSGGRVAGEPQRANTFLVTISLFGASDADFTALVPIYQKIKQGVVLAVDDHPEIAFRSLDIAPGCLRPAFNEAIDRTYAAIRLNINYFE